MKKLALVLILAGTSLAMADGAALYAKCAGCHGADGKTKALGKSDPIAGLAADVIVKDLEGYKAGTLNKHGMGGVMKGQANMSPEDMKAVAEHISKMAK
jgi:cytochrome c553